MNSQQKINEMQSTSQKLACNQNKHEEVSDDFDGAVEYDSVNQSLIL